MLNVFLVNHKASKFKRNLLFCCVLASILLIKIVTPYFTSLRNIESLKSDAIRFSLILFGISYVFIEKNFMEVGAYGFQTVIGKNLDLTATANIIDPHCWFIEVLVDFRVPILFYTFLVLYFILQKTNFQL